MNLSLVEAYWVGTSLITTIVTLMALADARQDVAAVSSLNGHVRGIVARGNFRREFIRLLVQVSFLAIAAPAVASDRETVITLPVLIFLAAPPLVLLNTLSDMRDRRRITRKYAADIETEREASARRLRERLDERADTLQATADDTNARVQDIQERTP